MYYIVGDIHGCYSKMRSLYNDTLSKNLSEDDTLIFLGDYIDRGERSFETIEYLIALARMHRTVFLKGNHESMLLEYISGRSDGRVYFYNGGEKTLQSYRRALGSFSMPESHLSFFKSLVLYYEGDNFIAVHAGLNPKIDTMESQSEEDMLWIREAFFNADKRWDMTVIFGHTPVRLLSGSIRRPHYDMRRNIIGLDTGAVYGGVLSCLRWPDLTEFQA